jgi:hypothetical protein
MFPADRTEGATFSIPPFELTPQDVDGFLDALRALHHPCRAGFARREPRAPFFHSLVGPCRARARKALEPTALHVAGGNIRGRQRCLSDDIWEADQRRQPSHGRVADEMGDPDGVRRFAESGVVNKGQDSVGVARQDGGTLGKGEKSPGGVVAASAARPGEALVDKRLCLPEQCLTEDDKDRRAPCHGPQDGPWHPHPPLAVERLPAIRREHRLPCTSMVADCL